MSPARRLQGDDSPKPRKGPGNKLCCCPCPPKARVWIEVLSDSITVANKIEIKRHFMTASDAKVAPDIKVNAAAASQTRVTATAACNTGSPPESAGDSVGADKTDGHSDSNTKVDADSDGKTEVDEYVFQDQGKVYRTDKYVVHWEADASCDCGSDLQVTLDVHGVRSYHADWLPASGSVALVKSWLLEPPKYQPADPAQLMARVTVTGCSGDTVTQENSSAV